MATTGISALGKDQIIAVASLSSKSAATAEYTSGGDNLQSLYTTVSTNSGSWSGRPQEPVSGINIDIFESAGTVVFSVSDDIVDAAASVAANSANWQSAYDQLGNVTALLNSL